MTTKYGLVIKLGLGYFSNGLLNFQVVELQIVCDPSFIALISCSAAHDNLIPVGDGPTSGCAALNSYARWSITIFLHPLLIRDQFGPRGWNFISCSVRCGIGTPDQTKTFG